MVNPMQPEGWMKVVPMLESSVSINVHFARRSTDVGFVAMASAGALLCTVVCLLVDCASVSFRELFLQALQTKALRDVSNTEFRCLEFDIYKESAGADKDRSVLCSC